MQKHRTHLKGDKSLSWSLESGDPPPAPTPCSKCGKFGGNFSSNRTKKVKALFIYSRGNIKKAKRGRKNCYQSQVLSEGFLCFWLVGVHVYIAKDLPAVYKYAESGTEEGNK